MSEFAKWFNEQHSKPLKAKRADLMDKVRAGETAAEQLAAMNARNEAAKWALYGWTAGYDAANRANKKRRKP